MACVQDQLWNNVYSDKFKCPVPSTAGAAHGKADVTGVATNAPPPKRPEGDT